MTEKKTGGSAFPQETKYLSANGQVQFEGPQGGMSMRDYFAAKVLQGLCASLQAGDNANAIPEVAYELADLMLEARK